MELDSTDDDQLAALSKTGLSKQKMAKACNKHVKPKRFVEEDLFWKAILQIGNDHLSSAKHTVEVLINQLTCKANSLAGI